MRPAMLALSLASVAASAHANEVTLQVHAPEARRVNVAGTFNGWKPDALAMTKDDGGMWTATLDLAPGAYLYKFIVDGNWLADPTAGAPVPPDGNSALWVTPDGKVPAHARGDGQIVDFAVKHQPSDLVRVDKTHARFTVRTAADDVGSVALSMKHGTADRSFHTYPMANSSSDGLTDTWTVTVPVAGSISYAFHLKDGAVAWDLGKNGLASHESSPASSFFNVNMDSLPLFETPAWVKDTVWYQVFPERFFDGDPSNDRKPPVGIPDWTTSIHDVGGNPNSHFWGGDLKGIIGKLPYLKSLGVSGIYLNPVFLGPDTHKYATTDYLKVDPDFGSAQDLKALCDAAHKLGIRVVLDGVFNHTSVYNPMFQDILKNQAKSRYAKWYRIKSFPVLDPTTHYMGGDEKNIPYEGWWGIKWMPRTNPYNADCAKYLLHVAKYWLQTTGADGWRLDVPNEMPHEFWRRFRTAAKGVRKNAVIIGEIWEDAADWLHGDEFDSVMNYRFRGAVLDFMARGKSDAAHFAGALESFIAEYPPQATLAMYNLLGSHDVPRLLTEAGGDERRAALATVFQMTWPGSPAVYYGDENGMEGAGDPWNRAPMPWDESKWNKSLHETFVKGIALRHTHPALRSIDVRTLLAPEGGKAVAFARGTGKDALITAFNASATEQSVAIPVESVSPSANWKDIWGGGKYAAEDRKLVLTLPPYGVAVLAPVR